MLQKFLQRPESSQNHHTRQHLHTETHFAAAFSAESPVEEIDSPDPLSLIKQSPEENNLQEKTDSRDRNPPKKDTLGET